MGVYNPWTEMPISCTACDFRYSCPLSSQNAHGLSSFKHPNCPLVEVKAPHGRLGDLDALRTKMYHEAFETDTPMQRWESGCWIRYKLFERTEEAAPTVLEAED